MRPTAPVFPRSTRRSSILSRPSGRRSEPLVKNATVVLGFGPRVGAPRSEIRGVRQAVQPLPAPLPAPPSTEVQTDGAWLVERPAEYEETVIAKLSTGTSLGVLSRGTGMTFNRTTPDYQW